VRSCASLSTWATAGRTNRNNSDAVNRIESGRICIAQPSVSPFFFMGWQTQRSRRRAGVLRASVGGVARMWATDGAAMSIMRRGTLGCKSGSTQSQSRYLRFLTSMSPGWHFSALHNRSNTSRLIPPVLPFSIRERSPWSMPVFTASQIGSEQPDNSVTTPVPQQIRRMRARINTIMSSCAGIRPDRSRNRFLPVIPSLLSLLRPPAPAGTAFFPNQQAGGRNER
jgi:hypothetical protein